MARKHGQTTYFIVGEGFVGEEASNQESPILGAALEPNPEAQAQQAERAFRFTRMFPGLKQFRPDIDALIKLGRAMDDTPNFKDHPTLAAGFTYFGQFLDHDITFDLTRDLPDSALTPEEIEQGRSPSLDLDSLYGRGPHRETKRLYEADKITMRIGKTVGLGEPGLAPESIALPNDLPRGDVEGKPLEAVIGDPRNDENLAVAQLHLAFLKFHNVVVAQLAQTGLKGEALFNRARQLVTMHYQWIVLYDFLPKVVETAILNQVIARGRTIFALKAGEEPAMPIEFSVAAYRFGHSMIRDGYTWNRNFPGASLLQLFQFTGTNSGPQDPISFLGGLPSNWPIDWRRFFDFSGLPGIEPTPGLNLTRSIDTALALTLKEIPSLQQENHKAPLAVRNLLRARALGLPTGQDVAEAIGAPVMTPEQVRAGAHAKILKANKFDSQTPLWYYILKEAEVFHNGERLGPVGSTLLAETFVGLIEGSRTSILSAANRNWRPTLPSLRPGHFSMVDLLCLVNDLNPLGAEFAAEPPPPPPARKHIVQPGDTLRGLAFRFLGDERRWREIFQANRDVIADPDKINPGMELTIPGA